MLRREFIMGLGVVAPAALSPLAVHAQQPLLRAIGFLSARSPRESARMLAAFHRGLGEAGFVEGQNLAITFRWAEGHYDRLPTMATELVGQRVAVILAAGGQPAALAAKAATTSIPIVFSGVYEPVDLGLVASLSRPGGNVTGMGMFGSGLFAKSAQLLREMIPAATKIAYLVNPSNPAAETYLKDAKAAESTLSIQVPVLNASTERGLEEAFARVEKLGASGLVVGGEPFFDGQRDRIAELAAQYAVPAIYSFREYVAAGGLMSYGTSLTDSYRRAAIYVGRILKGEKPTDLPVQLPTKIELVINLKTAKELGLTVPQSLLLRADEVIE
jgi:putative ABC transport system substrate-binding protein